MLKTYLNLTKSRIVFFVLLSGVAGYAMSFGLNQGFVWDQFILFLVGLYLVSSGSFILNQAQEHKIDRLMPRTKNRPIPSGKVPLFSAYFASFIFILLGVFFLSVLSELAGQLALGTVVLYNVLYTLWWKKHWAFGAVPGAIPGAMPVLIGYAIHSNTVLAADALYLFMIMFLWQMPHFWALAIRYREDYEAGGIPVLPARIGAEKTLYHMGLYLFVYIGLAMASPWFLKTNVLYVFFVVPVCLKLAIEFFKYFHSRQAKAWLPFFLWVNISMLLFLLAPVADRFIFFAFY